MKSFDENDTYTVQTAENYIQARRYNENNDRGRSIKRQKPILTRIGGAQMAQW